MTRSPSFWRSVGLFCGMAGIAAMTLSGCGGGKPATEPASTAANSTGAEATTPEPSSTASGAAPAPAKKPPAANEVHVDAKGKKWIGPIPYDVFFDDPLAVATNTQKVETASTAAPAGEKPADKSAAPTETDKPAASGSAGGGWKAVIPVKIIEAETKKTRNHLTENLQQIGKYNGNYKDLQVDGAVLAALGGIMTEHEEELSWKANAKFVRELGAQIEQNSQGLGQKAFKGTQEAFEKLTAVLDGSKPGDLADVPDKAPFNETADRAGLMKRMDREFNWAKKTVTTEAIFKSSADEVVHESAILAALSKVIALPGYPSADEDQYKKHAQAMIDSSLEMEKAVHTMDYKLFNDALTKMQKKCDECHTDYRFADGK